VVGEVNQGWEIAMTTLAHERGTGFAFKEQVLQRIAVEDLVRLARAQGRAGDPAIRQEVARGWIEVELMGLMNCRTLTRLERGEEPGPESSLVKLFWASLTQRLHQHEPGERHERHPADRVHRRRGGAERTAHHEGPDGGQVAARVVAEARSGAAEPRREELGQIEAERARNPVDGEPVQEEEAHAHERLPVAAEREPDRRGAARQVEREERAAAEASPPGTRASGWRAGRRNKSESAAGASPERKTTRQARSGCAASSGMRLVNRSLTNVARKMPSGELV